jgi:hypothetical protein
MAQTARLLLLALAASALLLQLPACGGETADDLGDLADPPPPDDLPDNYDDGLGTQLDTEPDAIAPTLPDPDPGTTPPSATPTCGATAKVGDYCGNDKVQSGSPNTLYRCSGPNSAAVVKKVCTYGCVVAPAGTDDYCKAAPASSTTPSSPLADACPHNANILKWGLHPVASDRLRCAGITAARISQTIGNYSASAGTHLQDGTASGHPYSAATDLSVAGLTDSQVKTLLTKLDQLGFAAFFRRPGHDGWPSNLARHCHIIFAGAKMKSILQDQVHDFLAGKNGLVGHASYTFYQPPASVKAYLKYIFNAAN